MSRRQAFEQGVKRAGALALIGVVERLLFTRAAGIAREIASRTMRDSLTRIETEFDAKLYLRQFRNQLRRCRAARAPALHYALLGWREHRAPNAQFDPAFYRRVTPTLGVWEDPFDHFIRHRGTSGAAPNETLQARQGDAAQTNPPSSHVLVLHHGRGGGSSLFLTLYERTLIARGATPVRLRPLTRTSPNLFVIEDRMRASHVFDIMAERIQLVDFVRAQGVTSILVNHVVDMPTDILSWVVSTARALEIPFDFILHDYFSVCPRINLMDDSDRFCDVGDVDKCRACIDAGGSEAGSVDIVSWRGNFAEFLSAARDVIVPSEDLRRRLAPYLGRRLTVWRPDDDEKLRELRRRPVKGEEPLRIAIIGGLTIAKGIEPIVGLGTAIRASGAALSLYLLGSSSNDRRLRNAGVTIIGRYCESELGAKIEAINPHLAFVPSIWPETWSFVLSHALRAELPTATFDLGAPAERLRALGWDDLVIPASLADRPDELMAFFLRVRARFANAQGE